jgi:hypothetical protein
MQYKEPVHLNLSIPVTESSEARATLLSLLSFAQFFLSKKIPIHLYIHKLIFILDIIFWLKNWFHHFFDLLVKQKDSIENTR